VGSGQGSGPLGADHPPRQPLSVPFHEQGMGYERRSIVFEKRLDP
jgi:hypothetical protein